MNSPGSEFQRISPQNALLGNNSSLVAKDLPNRARLVRHYGVGGSPRGSGIPPRPTSAKLSEPGLVFGGVSAERWAANGHGYVRPPKRIHRGELMNSLRDVFSPKRETITQLKEIKTAVLEYLRERARPRESQFSSFPTPIACKTEKLGDWHPKSLDAERRVGQPNAKLFPFIGRKVRTPGGPGTLLQVFAERVTVLLDSELSRCSFFRPTEIEPVSSGP
jgi:hypothetical protein